MEGPSLVLRQRDRISQVYDYSCVVEFMFTRLTLRVTSLTLKWDHASIMGSQM